MIRNLSADIARSWISVQIQDHVWVVPAFQSVHILAIAALVFASFSANLAIVRRDGTVPWLAGSYRWTWTALAVLLVSGTILITGEPTRSLMNVYFRVKVALVIVAALITLVLQRSLTGERRGSISRGALVALAGLSMAIWVAIIFCGRFIAYFGSLAE